MARLKRKTRLIRAVARKAAEDLAAEGDSAILDAAEHLARDVKWVSVDGALEILFRVAMHDMCCNGNAEEVAAFERALDRYNEEKHDD